MITVPDLLVRGLNLPELATPSRVHVIPVGSYCAITGVPIETGYPAKEVVSDANAEFLDFFKGGIHGYVSEAAARATKANRETGRSIVAFADGTAYLPLIARESALEQGRPCWSQLVRQVWPGRQGEPGVWILTTNTKKRLWQRARVGSLGNRTPLLYYDGETAGDQCLFVDWPRLLEYLDLVETVYTFGFPKATIRQSLWSAFKVVQNIGLGEARRLETEISRWRSTPEFTVATLIAQKKEE